MVYEQHNQRYRLLPMYQQRKNYMNLVPVFRRRGRRSLRRRCTKIHPATVILGPRYKSSGCHPLLGHHMVYGQYNHRHYQTQEHMYQQRKNYMNLVPVFRRRPPRSLRRRCTDFHPATVILG